MKISLAIASVALLLAIAGCSAANSKLETVSARAAPTPLPSPTVLQGLKALLFADQSLEELTKDVTTTDLNDPFALFASSLAASRQGKVEEAKKDLKRAMAVADSESRILLSAWKALRELGERPPANVAHKVQGVVCELHYEPGIATIAAYADGGARWYDGHGGGVIWESTGRDPQIHSMVQELLKSADPLVKTVPLTDTHKTPEPSLDYFRLSILTFSGIYTVEMFGPAIDNTHPMARVFFATLKLGKGLSEKNEAEKKAQSGRHNKTTPSDG